MFSKHYPAKPGQRGYTTTQSPVDFLLGKSSFKKDKFTIPPPKPTGMDMLKSAMKPFQNAYQGYQKAYNDSQNTPRGIRAKRKAYYEGS